VMLKGYDVELARSKIF